MNCISHPSILAHGALMQKSTCHVFQLGTFKKTRFAAKGSLELLDRKGGIPITIVLLSKGNLFSARPSSNGPAERWSRPSTRSGEVSKYSTKGLALKEWEFVICVRSSQRALGGLQRCAVELRLNGAATAAFQWGPAPRWSKPRSEAQWVSKHSTRVNECLGELVISFIILNF